MHGEASRAAGLRRQARREAPCSGWQQGLAPSHPALPASLIHAQRAPYCSLFMSLHPAKQRLAPSPPVDCHGWHGDGEARQYGGGAHLRAARAGRGAGVHGLSRGRDSLMPADGHASLRQHTSANQQPFAGAMGPQGRRAVAVNLPRWRAWRRGPAHCQTPHRPPPAGRVRSKKHVIRGSDRKQ